MRHDRTGNSSAYHRPRSDDSSDCPSESDRVRVIREGVASYLPDIDPEETSEWLESFDDLLSRSGPARARYLMLRMLERAGEQRVAIPALTSTDYVNTIPTELEPWFPGDEEVERRYRRWIRWNAAIMVHRAQRPGVGVGGHISTYASSAALYEVGFNHFFRGKSHPGGGDQVFIQGHGSPGIYARAFLEGRLSADQLDGFRQEHSHPGGGLPSYPHPRLMPEFWEFPTVSMGLGPMNAIFQARFNHYLHDRGIKDTSDQHVWAFLGDGEMDEPESRGQIQIAANEALDNLTFVVNCNLQRLDGPVRGNGKIIQELESFFRGAGWNVIKVVWGREWDALLQADKDGALVNLMNTTPDGDYQTYRANDGAYVREHFFGRDPRTKALVQNISDAEIWNLKRGGHDYRKVYAAYRAAMEHKGQPTVILAKTIKGYTLGAHFQGRNATHQMKKLALQDLKDFRDAIRIPISDAQLEENPYLPPYYHPGPESPEIRYLLDRRTALGGFVPARRNKSRALTLPPREVYEPLKGGSGTRRWPPRWRPCGCSRNCCATSDIGSSDRADHSRRGPHLRHGLVVPDAEDLQPQRPAVYRRRRPIDVGVQGKRERADPARGHQRGRFDGASFTAVGTSYSTHDEPMIPVYIFYSMFGFQRTGDSFWAAADQMARGFVLGATAGRTTLTGEGLQHADGHSLLLASTNPAVVAYDPAFAYELAYIVESGLARMFGENPENVYFYITIYNEPYPQPAEPENLDVEQLLRGMYRYRPATEKRTNVAQILASGVSMPGSAAGRRDAGRALGRGCRRVVGDVVGTNCTATAWPSRSRSCAIPTSRPRRPSSPRCSARTSGPGGGRVRTGCARCPSRSASGCRTPTSRWVPTGSASPTPGPRRGATSTPTPSRSWWPFSRRWPVTARSTRRCRSRRPGSTGSTT